MAYALRTRGSMPIPPPDPPVVSAPAPTPASTPAPRIVTAYIAGGLGLGSGGGVFGAVAEADAWPWPWLGAGIEVERAGNTAGNFYAARARLSLRDRVKNATFVTASVAVGPAKVETSDVKEYPCAEDDIACINPVGSDTITLRTNTQRENALGIACELGLHLQAHIAEGAALLRVAVDGPVVTVLLEGAIGFGF